ncbi:MAG: hypothetical protein AAGD96_05555 [Chloroflexota bacterium]
MMNISDENFQWVDPTIEDIYEVPNDPKKFNVEPEESPSTDAFGFEALLDESGLVDIAPAVTMFYSSVSTMQNSYALKPAVHVKQLEELKNSAEVSQDTQVIPAAPKVTQPPQPAFPTVKLNQFNGLDSAKKKQRNREMTAFVIGGVFVVSIIVGSILSFLF